MAIFTDIPSNIYWIVDIKSINRNNRETFS